MLKIGNLIPFYDLSNGLKDNSFMRSPSRVKSIIKPLENIEQNLNFQKSKVKKIDFKKTSIFETQPEVVLNEISDSLIITTPTTIGNY